MNKRESWQDWYNRALRAMCLMNFDLIRLAIVAVAVHSALSGHAWFGALVIAWALALRYGMGYDYYAPPPTEDSE